MADSIRQRQVQNTLPECSFSNPGDRHIYDNFKPIDNTLQQLAMPINGYRTPDGYKQPQTAWLNPDAITRRLNFAIAPTCALQASASANPAGVDSVTARDSSQPIEQIHSW